LVEARSSHAVFQHSPFSSKKLDQSLKKDSEKGRGLDDASKSEERTRLLKGEMFSPAELIKVVD